IPFETRKEAGGTSVLITLQSHGERLQMLLDTGTNDIMQAMPTRRGGCRSLYRAKISTSMLAVGTLWHRRVVSLEIPRWSRAGGTLPKQQLSGNFLSTVVSS